MLIPAQPCAWRQIAGVVLAGCIAGSSALAGEAGAVVTEPAGTMDIGTVLSDDVRDVKFSIVNRTPKPITITRVRAGCACTVPEEPPHAPLPPGGKATVGLRFLGAKVPAGAFERSAIVELADAPVASVTLTFRGTMVHAISILPGETVSLTPAEAATATWERVFQIQSHLPGGQRLRLDAPVTSPRLAATLKEMPPASFEITVRPKQALPRGRVNEEIRIAVLEPAGHGPVLIHVLGQNGPMLLAIPQTVRVADDGSGTPVSASVMLYQVPPLGAPTSIRLNRKPIAAGEIKCRLPPGITVVPAEKETGTVLTFTFQPAAVKASGDGNLEIDTDCCGGLALPYTIRRAAANQTGR